MSFNKKRVNKITEKKRFLRQIFMCFLLPIPLIVLSIFLVYNNYKNLSLTQLRKNSISNLSALADVIDSSLDELQNTTLLLSSNNDLYDIFYSNDKLNQLDSYKIETMKNTLVKFKSTKALIDSVYVLHKTSDEIIDTSGTYDTKNFFGMNSIYKDYSRNFWMNLNVNTPYYKILNSTTLKTATYDVSSKRNVIPFVTANIESFKSPNLFVINISGDKLQSLLNKYKFISSMDLSIVNKKGVMFDSTNSPLCSKFVKNKNFLQILKKSKNSFSKLNVNGNTYMVMSFSSSTAKFNDFIYVAFIPYNDFYKNLVNVKKIAYLIVFFSMCISVFCAYFLSKKIYSPINNLVHILKKNNPNSSYTNLGEIKYLNSQIEEIIASKDTLKNNVSELTPLVSTQYLTKILTDINFMMDEDIRNFIYSNELNFPYSSFCVSIFELNFTENYNSLYTYEECLLAVKGISKMLQSIALGNYSTQLIKMSKTRICLVINIDKNECIKDIIENIKDVISIFTYDRNLIDILVGIGRPYPFLRGMNKSYAEAFKALSSLSPLCEEKIKLYSSDIIKSKFNYSISDENKLYNFLIGCYKDESINLIDSIIEKNTNKNSSTALIKSLYISIYNTILRAADDKKLSTSDIMDKNYLDITSDIDNISIGTLDNYIRNLVVKFLNVNKRSGKFDINEITSYVNNHYNEDIYLEKVAEIFNISDKYLSKIFKTKVGIPFHNYLSNLRIAESKKLLLETDLSVTKIGEMVGFSTHSTFFRMFKKFEGVNPTQYRNSMR